jgi:CubicO group peptidase (beta-lactamase class C family)
MAEGRLTMRALRLSLMIVCGLTACAKRPFPTESFPRQATMEALDADFLRAEKQGAIPAAAIVVRHDGEVVYRNAFGTLLPAGDAPAVTTDSLFDIASLTKPMLGVPVGLLLIRMPTTTTFEHRVIFRLFQHSIGLDDSVHYPHLQGIEPLFDPDTMLPAAYRYANSNFLFVTFRARKTLPSALEDVRKHYWQPLGVEGPTFHPGTNSVWSGMNGGGEILTGEPFDPVAGQMIAEGYPFTLHSGLFASAEDVALYADALLRNPDDRHLEVLSQVLFGPTTTLPLAEEPTASVVISQGGMLAASAPPFATEGAPAGRFYYHSGYTGCLLWVDTQEKVSVALLSNAAALDAQDAWEAFSEQIISTIVGGLDQQQ